MRANRVGKLAERQVDRQAGRQSDRQIDKNKYW